MKTRKWFVKVISLILLFTILPGSIAWAGWEQDGGRWWYSYENGGYARNTWIQESDGWYYFDNGGYMVTGWQKIGGWWYHFNSSGKMETGWINDGGTWYYLEETGAMATGWVKDGETWYYLNPNGAMVTGWIKDGASWYYLEQNGAMVTGWQKIGSWYHFNSSGKMDTGWINDEGTWYYLDRNGAAATGWQKIDGAWYYFDASGKMYADAYIDQKYYVDANGRWDGVTRSSAPETVSVTDTEDQDNSKTTTFTFHQNGWYVARLEVEVWDKAKQDFKWIYSDSKSRDGKATLSIDTNKYEVNRVGYQSWFFGWNNDYMNLPWANTDYATDFTLSGYGDYPEFTWK